MMVAPQPYFEEHLFLDFIYVAPTNITNINLIITNCH